MSSPTDSPAISVAPTPANNVATKSSPTVAPKTLLPAPTPTVSVWGNAKKKSVSGQTSTSNDKSWPTAKAALDGSSNQSNLNGSGANGTLAPLINATNTPNAPMKIKKTEKWIHYDANIVISESSNKTKKRKGSKKKNSLSTQGNGNGNGNNTNNNNGANDGNQQRKPTEKTDLKQKPKKKSSKDTASPTSSTEGKDRELADDEVDFTVESKIEEINKQIDNLNVNSDSENKQPEREGSFNNSSSASPFSRSSELTREGSDQSDLKGDRKQSNGDVNNFNSNKQNRRHSYNNGNARHSNNVNTTNNSSNNNNYRNSYRNQSIPQFMPNFQFMVPGQFQYYSPSQYVPMYQQPPAPSSPNSNLNKLPGSGSSDMPASPGLGGQRAPIDPNVLYNPYGFPFQPPPPIIENQLTVIARQVSYYFSLENLIKDIYLRSHMDGEGFIKLNKLIQFNRLRLLTNGDLKLLIKSIKTHCSELELVDDEKIRLAFDWDKWILPSDQRV